MPYRRPQYRGITLIELLIGITLSLFILSMLIEIFLATEKNHRALAALTDLQDNANIAIQLLSKSIRTAGYSGCAQIFPMQRIEAKSNAIIIHRAAPSAAILLEPMHNYTNLRVTQSPLFIKNKALFISDCQSAEIFFPKQIKKMHGAQMIETNHPLKFLYDRFAEVSELETQTFFVAQTGRYTEQGQPISALYVNKTELVEGVDTIKFQYTILLNHSLIEKNADELDGNEKIRGISIELTLSSLNSFPLQKKAYTYVALREG